MTYRYFLVKFCTFSSFLIEFIDLYLTERAFTTGYFIHLSKTWLSMLSIKGITAATTNKYENAIWCQGEWHPH